MSKPNIESEEKWTNHIEFLLSVIGYAVGLGNIWRFPYLAYSNGGGAFLIPYLLFLILAGIPMFYMELGVGQFTACRPINAFSMVPILKGVGYAMGIISGLVTLYYNVIIAYAAIYLYESCKTQLPWGTCDNYWNSLQCIDRTKNKTINIISLGIPNIDKLNRNYLCRNETIKTFLEEKNIYSELYIDKLWNYFNCSTFKSKSPSEEFWTNYVLDQSDGILNTGKFLPKLVVALAVSWIILFVCLSKGIKSSGKVVYVTSVLPYLLITIMLIRASILPGAKNGILYFIKPDWSKLKDGSVWIAAASQIFYSLGVGFGTLLLYSSYNEFNNKFERDAILCSVINCATSIYAGFAVFAIIGNLSAKTGLPIKEVVTEGVGLIFVVYPEVLVTLPVSQFWSFLLFLMIISVGLDTQFGMHEAFLSIILDSFDFLRRWRTITTFFCCLIWFLLGLPLTTQSGIYWLTLMDARTAQLSLILVACFEIIIVSWIYGYKNFADDIRMMTGSKPNYYWQFGWFISSPLVLIGIMIFSCISYQPVSYDGKLLPPFTETLGWGMFIAPILCIPIYAIYMIISKVYIQGDTFKSLFLPNERYGPISDENRDGIRYKIIGKPL